MAQTLLAFDFGALRIGVAVGNTVSGTATPLAVIPTEPVAARWNAIAELVRQWQPQRLVVGRPRHHVDARRAHADASAPATEPVEPATEPTTDPSTDPPIAARCERFARQLAGRYRLPVEFVDEGWSSFEAGATLAATPGRQRGRDGPDDAEAAAVILRQYLSCR